MNDRYVGDVGDFSKFALLRLLERSSEEAIETAVLWWATKHAGGSAGDGRHTGFVTEQPYLDADRELAEALHAVQKKGRRIAHLEQANLLRRVRYHSEPIDGEEPLRPRDRPARRAVWLEGAIEVARGADVVFVDPDNGLVPMSMRTTNAAARKTVVVHELASLVTPDQTLVVYHHSTRQRDHAWQAKFLADRLRQYLPKHDPVVVLRAPRFSPRFYGIVPAVRHRAMLANALETLLTPTWRHLFEVSTPPTFDLVVDEVKKLLRPSGPHIRCPRCAWRPSKDSRWVCVRTCGATWNTFDTHGKCPKCARAWAVTQCLSCHAYSPHEDWYEQAPTE